MTARLLTLCALLASQAALAQQGDEEELALVYGHGGSVSIASGSAMPLRRAPAVATVITSADIEAMGATELDQVLETIPGFHVNRAPNQYTPLYVVRGIVSTFAPQLLVLQNGIPITTLYVGNKGNVWGGYPVEHIARIEILRGPGSALYGADAFSGVINIITKSAADTPGTTFGARAGSFGTGDLWVQHGGRLGPAELAVYLRAGHTDGIDRIVQADAQSRNDTLGGTRASLAPGRLNLGVDALDANLDLQAGRWRLRAGLKVRDDMGTGAGVAAALDPVGRSGSDRVSAELSWHEAQLARDWGASASLSTQYYRQRTPVDYQLLPPGQRFPTGLFERGMIGGPDFSERTTRLSGSVVYSGLAGHALRVGLGHDDLDLYRTSETRNFDYTAAGLPIPRGAVEPKSGANIFLRPQRRTINYLYLQDEWHIAPDWALTAGVRHDRYSDFGGTTNPRLALVWDASHDVTLKLLHGRAFRAPAFLESYGQGNPVAFGNPDLRPETNRSTELVLAWQARPDTTLNATLYRYDMASIIRAVPNATAGTGSTYRNTGDQDGHGLELEASSRPLRELLVHANYSLQRSTDKASGRDAGYAPRHHFYARADWQFAPGYHLGPQLNWIGSRARPAGDLRAPLAGYRTVDLTLRTSPGPRGWRLAASVRNLFNADVREPSPAPGLQLPHDLPMARRTLSIQASVRL